jgi:diacylglycerol O-acyltransferase / wax synthase
MTANDMRFERRMSDSDALLWRVERDPLLRSTITSVAVFDGPFDRERLEHGIERTTRLVPRLRQRVLSSPISPSPPRWVVDPGFDIRYHVRWVHAPGEGTLRDVLDLAEPLAMQGFDRARPLWEFTVVEGVEGGRSAIIMKIHHSITDGVGAVKLYMSLVDLERDAPPQPMPEAPAPERPGLLERFIDSAEHERRRQLGIARRSVDSLGRLVANPGETSAQAVANLGSAARLLAPAFSPLSPLMTGRSLSVRFDHLSVPTDELKAAARRAEAKLNDAFVAAVAGGLRRYHEHHGRPCDALRMTMPINVRGDDDAGLAGNAFVPARFPVPICIDDPVARMRAVRDLVQQQRREPSLGFSEGIAGILNRLPVTVVTDVFGRMLKGIDLVTSNVPGVPIPVYMAGARLEAQFAFGPLAGSAMNLTLLSYVDECQIGVNVDPAAVPDADALLACLRESFDEVRKA